MSRPKSNRGQAHHITLTLEPPHPLPNLTTRYDLLHCLNEEEGLLAEATFQTHFGALPSMTAVAKTLHGKAGTRTLQLGLEEFQEGDFDDAVRRMYAFFGFPDDEVRAGLLVGVVVRMGCIGFVGGIGRRRPEG